MWTGRIRRYDNWPKRETEMSGLVVGFAMQMRKRAANAQGENEKCSRLDEEVQADPVVITLDS